MQVESLDHVALWVADRDRLAAFLADGLGLRVIDRTDAFTLLGADARRGKLTLFASEGPRAPGALVRIGLRFADLERVAAGLPRELARERDGEAIAFIAPEGLGLALVEGGPDGDIDHVVLRMRDPARARTALLEHGLAKSPDGRLVAGDAFVDLLEGDPGAAEAPLLNHLGLRVESAADRLREARDRGFDVADVVDAANTLAVFVWGPEGVKLEYVEHKPSFSLV